MKSDLLYGAVEDVDESRLCGSVRHSTREISDDRHSHGDIVVTIRMGTDLIPTTTLVGTPVLTHQPVVPNIRPTSAIHETTTPIKKTTINATTTTTDTITTPPISP